MVSQGSWHPRQVAFSVFSLAGLAGHGWLDVTDFGWLPRETRQCSLIPSLGETRSGQDSRRLLFEGPPQFQGEPGEAESAHMCCPFIDLHHLATGPIGGCDLCSAQKSHQEAVETDVSSPLLQSPDPAGHSATSSLNGPGSPAAHICCRFCSLHTHPVPGASPVGGAGLSRMVLSLGDPLRLTSVGLWKDS